jgi:hypothetical protein
MTNYETDGPEIDEDADCLITAYAPAKARIHKPHLAVIRLGKAALVAAIEVGAVLHQERSRFGDDFEEWVDTQLALSPSEAECYVRFYEESRVRPEQLSPAVEVKLPRVLELLGQLNAGLRRNEPLAQGTRTTESDGCGRPKATDFSDACDTPTKQAPEASAAKDQPAEASTRPRKQSTRVAEKTEPVQLDRDDRQSALTAEQRQFLVRRSPRLFARVRKGELPTEEALRLARDLPDRSSPQISQRR